MTRKHESITLSLSPEHKAELEQLSVEFGCLWGKKPSVSALLKAIADGELLLSRSNEPAKQKRKLIKEAINSIQNALTILKEQ